MTNSLLLSDFDFTIPEEIIAQTPADRRSDARLLYRQKNGSLEHHSIKDLGALLGKNTLMILNNTSVIQSRLHGYTATGARVEIFLLEPISTTKWRALAKPFRKIKLGNDVFFSGAEASQASAIRATVTGISQTDAEELPIIDIDFSESAKSQKFDFSKWLDDFGETPLPPYIRRKNLGDSVASLDRSRYQTVFAEVPGSVAAPTAGLHFSEDLLDALHKQGVETTFVTLHVGGGTFLPVKKNNPKHHQIHTERYLISKETVELIQRTRHAGGKICCVGTTAFRAIESLWQRAAQLNCNPTELSNEWHKTSLFICPETTNDRYQPTVADILLTNFHQPKSTLIMLVAGLVGLDEIKKMYDVAVRERYRFYSYGDATLLELR